jgi:hypothetical protein
VKAIVGHYRWALENVVETCLAFDHLHDAASTDAVHLWEASIQEAEFGRSDDPTTMDIMQS